jgi:sorbitol-specific phosphotransferase system component IIA
MPAVVAMLVVTQVPAITIGRLVCELLHDQMVVSSK